MNPLHPATFGNPSFRATVRTRCPSVRRHTPCRKRIHRNARGSDRPRRRACRLKRSGSTRSRLATSMTDDGYSSPAPSMCSNAANRNALFTNGDPGHAATKSSMAIVNRLQSYSSFIHPPLHPVVPGSCLADSRDGAHSRTAARVGLAANPSLTPLSAIGSRREKRSPPLPARLPGRCQSAVERHDFARAPGGQLLGRRLNRLAHARCRTAARRTRYLRPELDPPPAAWSARKPRASSSPAIPVRPSHIAVTFA